MTNRGRHDEVWWRHAVVYQVYLRSFADGNGDGIGDLAGLRSRLQYLADLGVDAIWVNPWYLSPMRDGGYDVADYRQIDPRYGTLAAAEAMIEEAHRLGLRVLADLVPNHTSSEHEWFRQALAADPGSPERDRYIFRAGRGSERDLAPTDWTAVFGGSAWERLADGDWYLHLFDVSQPDLNWDHPEVRAEFEAILRFWLDRDIDGFRVDVAHGLVKDPTFPDIGAMDRAVARPKPPNHPHWDRDEVHEIVREWRRVVDSYDGDRVLVAEAWVSPDRLPLYTRPGEYHQCFDFNFLRASWSATAMQPAIDGAVRSAHRADANLTWVLSNHDVVRHATRYGLPVGTDAAEWMDQADPEGLDAALGERRARAAALLLLALPGSAYVYQGEELGLPEVWDLPTGVLDDPVWEMSGRTRRGRDGCRVPLPWVGEDAAMGFGGKPWLPQPESFRAQAVDTQVGDRFSMLELYRRAIALRNQYLAGATTIAWLDLGTDVMAFRSGASLCCVVNFGSTAVILPEGEVLVASSALDTGRLAPDAAVWVLSP